jgi:hypothetical protein
MTASVTSPEDVVNNALTRIGYSERINNMREGTRAARAAVLIYAQTRDELLRDGDWGFAQATIAAVPSGQAAPGQWSVSYAYPADCLKVRNLISAAYLTDKSDPLPILFEVASNVAVGRVILTDEASAMLVYTAQIIDPTRWDALFADALAAELARRLAPALENPETEKLELEDEKMTTPLAQRTVG